MALKLLTSVKNLAGKRVLVRADFNVPIKNGVVANDYKIQRSLPTLEYLRRHKATCIVMSHLGRPNKYDLRLSLEPVRRSLQRSTGAKVLLIKIKKMSDLDAIDAVCQKNPGAIVLLDNIRFLAEERDNDNRLSRRLAQLADMFVSECFAVTHHAAPSVSGVAKFLPSYAGLLLAEEVKVLSAVMTKPKRPLVVILGGVKVETKIPVLKNLLPRADYILVAGGIASTYWWSKGYAVGTSTVGKEYKKEILKICSSKKIILPTDVVVGDAKGKKSRVVSVADFSKRPISGALGIYDIGPQTVALFSRYIKKANTLVWNGAPGMFEVPPYQFGTYALNQLLAARSWGRAYGVAGGGETVEILEKLKIAHNVDLVSTGGGAMLEFLGGVSLPGITAVSR